MCELTIAELTKITKICEETSRSSAIAQDRPSPWRGGAAESIQPRSLGEERTIEAHAAAGVSRKDQIVGGRDDRAHDPDDPHPEYTRQPDSRPVEQCAHAGLPAALPSPASAMNQVSSRPGAVGSIRTTCRPAAAMACVIVSRLRKCGAMPCKRRRRVSYQR